MKKYRLYSTVLFVATLILSSCDKKEVPTYPEEPEAPVVPEIPEINIGTDLIEPVIGKSVNFEIKNGAGDYKVMVLDEEIAQASVTESSLNVTGLKLGQTDIILSDNAGEYKNIKVDVYTDQIILDKEVINVGLFMGNPNMTTATIELGNGDYQVKSHDEEVATVEFSPTNPNVLIIHANKVGETVIEITDRKNIRKEVRLVADESDSPFTDEELEKIKADPTERYMIGDKDVKAEFLEGSIYSEVDTYKGQQIYLSNTYYPGEYEGYGFGPYLKGDRSYLLVCYDYNLSLDEGEIEGAKLIYQLKKYNIADLTDATVKIIKRDGKKVWATFFALANDGSPIVGHMVFDKK